MITAHPTPVLHTASDVRADVDRHLRTYYDQRIAQAEGLDPAYAALWQSMTGLAFAGGKRMRPYLIVLAYEMYGGRQYADIVPVAAAAELLHLSLLVHDDITDKDTIRYGTDNITGIYQKRYSKRGAGPEDSRHYAESAALLAGDLLLSAAHGMLLECGLPAEQRLQAHRLITRAVFEVAAGQLLDMEAGMNRMSDTDAFKVARLKTASYSFVSPMRCGATLAGADDHELAKLEALGNVLGLAFQLSDDLLGVFGDESVTGKSSLTDLQEGKHTYMMQLAFDLATAAQRRELEQLVGKHDLDAAQAGVIRQIIIDCGAKAKIEHALAEQRQQAEQHISQLAVAEPARGRLLELVAFVTRRDR